MYFSAFETDTVVEFFQNIKENAPLKIKTDKIYIHTTKIMNEVSNSQNKVDTREHTFEKVTTVNERLCDRGLCCDFSFIKRTKYCLDEPEPKYSFKGDDFGLYKYRLDAFNGVRTYDSVTTGGAQICSITSCLNENDVETCGKRTDDIYQVPEKITLPTGYTYKQCHTSFDNITIRAEMKYDVKMTFITSNILLSSTEYTTDNAITRYGVIADPFLYSIVKVRNTSDNSALYEFRGHDKFDNPLSINLYNRVFELDHTAMTLNRVNSSFNIPISLLVLSFVFSFFFYYQHN